MGRNTVTITTQVWGEHYGQFLPRWWESVRRLKRQPDEIVLVGATNDVAGLFDSIPGWVTAPVITIRKDLDTLQEYMTEAVSAASCDYIVIMPADDQFGEHALDAIDETDADLIIDNCQFLQGGEWPGNWDIENSHDRRFAPAGMSPFRKSLLPLWKKIPSDCYWNDYVFYLVLAKANVSTYRTSNVRIIHDLGHGHKTLSGVMLDTNTRLSADDQLRRIREELGV